jgi:hypothetical protein
MKKIALRLVSLGVLSSCLVFVSMFGFNSQVEAARPCSEVCVGSQICMRVSVPGKGCVVTNNCRPAQYWECIID